MLEFVIVKAENVFALKDILDMLVKEVRFTCIFWWLLNVHKRRHIAACPGNCNGRGTCYSLRELSTLNGPDYDNAVVHYGDGIGTEYVNWDADSITMCVCDANFFGPDCSLCKFLFTHLGRFLFMDLFSF